MIIFTVTNTVTSQIYVGSTRNDLDVQWEKMVAAAEQNLDYPLYRDIRRHGVEAFQREIYDMAETREELSELENDALEILGGISLRGHKTSTVVIKKKKPVRRRKSDAEKELLALLDDYATDTPDEDATAETKKASDSVLPHKQPPKEDAVKGRVIKNEPATVNKPTPAAPVRPQSSKAQKIDAVAAAKAILAAAAKEEDEKRAAAAKTAAPRRASRTNGNVKLELTIDDTINAQLAAITAAVDGVLAGDSAATDSLQTLSTPPDREEPAPLEADTTTGTSTEGDETQAKAESKPTLNEVTRIISGKEKRIVEAIQRHRESRAQRTSDVLNAEKEQIQELLSELNNRIASMDTPSIQMYH